MGAEAFLTLQIVDFAEGVDDRVAALLQAGTGITLTYNDGAGTLTIANTGLGGSTGSTDNRILRADGTGGATVQNSAVTIDDSGNISGLGTVGCGAITASGQILTIAGSKSTPAIRLGATATNTGIYGSTTGTSPGFGFAVAGAAFIATGDAATGFCLHSAWGLCWTSGQADGTVDTAIRRSSAGVVEINNGTAGTLRDLSCRAITASGNVSVTGWIDASSIRCDGSQVFDTSGSRIDVGRSGGFQIATMPGTLQLGNTDAFAPAIKRKAVDVPVAQIRLANDSGFADLELASLIASGLVTAGVYTVATLPRAAANAGALAQVTDSSVTTNGSPVAGGGSSRVVVFSNGSTWDVVVA